MEALYTRKGYKDHVTHIYAVLKKIDNEWNKLLLGFFESHRFKKKTAGNKEKIKEQRIKSHRAEMPARPVCA